ncbi:MAG TPA: uroporphyrinogen-III synthase [Candidatus Paceibacterota bacterium]
MHKQLDMQVTARRVPLTPAGAAALKRLASYDLVVFSSKQAQSFFMQLLRKRGIKLPPSARMLRVGPRKDLLHHAVAGKRILYPRSALAPYDIVRALRAKGTRVVPLVIYTVLPVPLGAGERRMLTIGKAHSISFRSPSGVRGLLSQLSAKERRIARTLPAYCIGGTTAAAARAAGFSKAVVKRL